MANGKLRRERDGHTLQTTVLVHEAYLKLVGGRQRYFANRMHFLAVASRVMGQILVDGARAKAARKRHNGAVPLNPGVHTAVEPAPLPEVSEALDALALEDESLARLVRMRFFWGMTAEETAMALGRSVHVVRHDLRLALHWLRQKLHCKQAGRD